jgi:hypothetical protein
MSNGSGALAQRAILTALSASIGFNARWVAMPVPCQRVHSMRAGDDLCVPTAEVKVAQWVRDVGRC